MNTVDPTRNRRPDDAFDAAVRDVHAHALDALSPRTRAQLQLRRRAAAAPSRPWAFRTLAWPLALTCAVAALAIGWQLRPERVPVAPAQAPLVATTTDSDSPTLALDENPELYAWLASGDADALAME